MDRTRASRGFTVIELLVTLLVTGLLIGLSFLLAHPKDFTEADANAQRQTDVAQLIQATRHYAVDNNGALPPGITDKDLQIGNGGGMLDLCKAFVPKYMKDIPLDPTDGGQYAAVDCRGTESEPGQYVTGYTIKRAADGTVTVSAPAAAKGKHISISYKL
jgi:prepilin-type N-terminal cleavage/methylation domain-containing protein